MNAKDEKGRTALMWATSKNSTDTVRLLMEAGADVNAKDNDGKTALMYADDYNAWNVESLLKKAGAR